VLVRFVLQLACIILFSFVQTEWIRAEEIPPGEQGYKSHVQPFFQAHCVDCHGPDLSKGGMTLHDLDSDLSSSKEGERWDLVLRMLESGKMPPEGELQPNTSERENVTRWINTSLREFIYSDEQFEIPPTARRLTNLEYENTLGDLLGFKLHVIDDLSPDPVKPYQFNNTAEFMRLGPEQLDRYLECARRAMKSAIVDVEDEPEKPELHTTRREWLPHGLDKGLGFDEVGVWGNRRNSPASGMGLKSFPKTGEYRIRVKASAILPPGINEMPLRLVMGYGLGENSSTLQVEPVGTIRLTNNPDSPRVFEFRGRIENHPARPGRLVNGKLQNDTMAITPQNLYDDGTLNDGNRQLAMPRAVIEWLEFEAPVADVWPPSHHTRILFESPLRNSDPPKYVREVLSRFMRRAYRRPVSEQEVDRFAEIYDLVLPELKTMEAAMRETLAMVLVSPQFLYHTTANDEHELQEYELASKLSYFLWGSMPDDELLKLASEGKLKDATTIDQQARRMLADERSQAFVENFTTQWLSLSKMKTVPINSERFPRFLYYVSAGERAGTEVPYRPTIRDFMQQETIGFIGELIRRNDSVMKIVDSDFAYLNQPLATHYGVKGVQGHEFRPVKIKPENNLGGLLTHGSVLIGNGTGTAPHPIYRAVWLREAILGEDVAPPPADVPALSDSAGESAETEPTIKALLRSHRQKESCNDCHSQLDPWGIPFEHYNAIGKFQPVVPKAGTRVSRFNKVTHKDLAGYATYLNSLNTIEVEAHARVPHGPSIDGMAELKAHLVRDRHNEICENVLRKLLSYSLGRKLTWRDRFAVDDIMAEAQKNEFKFQDMIVAICQSELFHRK